MSQPPKSTIFAPNERCTEFKGVVRSDAFGMKIQPSSSEIGVSNPGGGRSARPGVVSRGADHWAARCSPKADSTKGQDSSSRLASSIKYVINGED